MSSISLVLGPVCFHDFEVPAQINIGGKQLLAIHQLAGGRRIVDCMGPADADIEFSGTFSGPTATSRARLLDLLRSTGSDLNLTWDAFVYTVVIGEFKANYSNPLWIPFSISCTVVRDKARSLGVSTPSILDSISAAVASAAAQCSASNIDFSNISALLVAADATIPNTSGYLATTAGLNDLQSDVQSGLNSSQPILTAPLSTSQNTTPIMADTIVDLSNAAQQVAQLSYANGFLGCAAKVLSSGST